MIIRQYQLECLSLFSYLVADPSTGRAVVIDPQRDISIYLAEAAADGLTIEAVIETHFHADFVSGHLELASATGARILYGPSAIADYAIETMANRERLSLGDVQLEFRHTPGHTPESMCIVAYERADAEVPTAIFSGDTLFIGDVGRPDLLTSLGVTADDLARRLYHSLQTEILTLPDETVVYPAHGAGSACGKSLSDATSSTIGAERRSNYALAPMAEDEFVAAVTEGQSVAPLYFVFAATTNRRERELLDDAEPPRRFALDQVLAAQADGTVVVDCRAPEVFASGHLRGAINVGLDGRFAEYAGDIVRPGQSVIVVTDAGRETEAKVRLARIGFDGVIGALDDVEAVLIARPDLAKPLRRLNATEVAAWIATDDVQVVDVRNPGEVEAGALPGAVNIPLPVLMGRLDELDSSRPTVVYCAGGYRSAAASSALSANGFDTVADLIGGYDAWVALAAPHAVAAG